jgi:hypothetical protein
MLEIRGFKGVLALWLIITAMSGAVLAADEAKIKVHKNFITVSEPDEKGFVKVTGKVGAIETTRPAVAWLVRVAAKEKVSLTVRDDGSFEGSIAAKAGEKVRVLAKNQQKKQSYATFTVPGKPAAPSEKEKKDKPKDEPPETKPAPEPEKDKEGEKDPSEQKPPEAKK